MKVFEQAYTAIRKKNMQIIFENHEIVVVGIKTWNTDSVDISDCICRY